LGKTIGIQRGFIFAESMTASVAAGVGAVDDVGEGADAGRSRSTGNYSGVWADRKRSRDFEFCARPARGLQFRALFCRR